MCPWGAGRQGTETLRPLHPPGIPLQPPTKDPWYVAISPRVSPWGSCSQVPMNLASSDNRGLFSPRSGVEALGVPPASPHFCPCWQSSVVLGFSVSLVLWSPHVPLLRTEVTGGGPAALQAEPISMRSHLRGTRGRQNHTAREACMRTGAKSPGFPSKDPPRACSSPGSHRFLEASAVGGGSPGEQGGRERTVKEGGQSVLPQVPAQPVPPSLDLCSWVTSSHKPPALTPPERHPGTVPPCPTHSCLVSSLLLPGARAPT